MCLNELLRSLGIVVVSEDTMESPSSKVSPLSDESLNVVSQKKDPNPSIKRYVLAILALLIIVGGVAAGIILVQRNQEIREKACGSTSYVAECDRIRAYNTNWEPLTTDQLSSFKAGDVVRFTVSGTASQGSISKARFIINGAVQPDTTAKKPGSNEFFSDYTIPADTYEFKVQAQLYHSAYGWF